MGTLLPLRLYHRRQNLQTLLPKKAGLAMHIKYTVLRDGYIFKPIDFETFGSCSDESNRLILEIKHSSVRFIFDIHRTTFLHQ